MDKNHHSRRDVWQRFYCLVVWRGQFWHKYIGTTGFAKDCRVTCADIFAVAVRFQNQDQCWIPHQKLQGGILFYFIEKLKNELVWPKMMYLAILLPEWIFSEIVCTN